MWNWHCERRTIDIKSSIRSISRNDDDDEHI